MHTLSGAEGGQVNYEELLKKFIKHVDGCEGVTFLGWRDEFGGQKWTDEEWEVLKRLESEAFDTCYICGEGYPCEHGGL